EVAGNHVELRCGAYHVVLAHLQRGSVAGEVGARVNVGARLGVVGNSGNTSEPHLHIHAVSARAADREQWLWKGSGVPLTFGGRFLVRGDTAEW
ncbi:MAG TPA: M23 family metallopeptidase, partial [Polyangiaceae bacterium]|nr:M23 family metallopeptidase [Polyangiaceae bacterium]